MRWKWILGIAAILFAALIITIYVILSSYDYNNLKPHIAQAAKDATGRGLTLGGDINLKISLTPALVVENVSFQNAPWGSRPELARIKRFEVQVALFPLIFGNINVKRFVLIEPDIMIETNKRGRWNFEFEVPKKAKSKETEEKKPADVKTKLPPLSFEEVRIEKGRLIFKDGRSGKTYSTMLDNLTAKAKGMDTPINLNIKGAYNNEPFNVKGKFGSLLALSNPEKDWLLDFTSEIIGASLNVDGTIKNPLEQRGIKLSFKTQVKELASIGNLVGKPLPLKGPFKMSGLIVDTAPKIYKISDIKAVLGNSDLDGSVVINLASLRPRLNGVISSQKLDLQSILEGGNKTEKEAKKKATKRKKLFPNNPLPLEALKQADADVKLKVTKLLLPQMAFNDLNSNIILKDGRLKVKPLKAIIGNGAMDGRFDLQPDGKAAALKSELKVNQLDFGLMLKELKATNVLEGKLDIDVDLNGRGSSIATMMGGLNGKVVVMMNKGRIYNKYISLLGGDISSSIIRMLNPLKKKEDFTEINCFVCRFDIKDGIADTTALVFDTKYIGVVGNGKVNLKTEKLDISLKPIPKESIEAKGVGKFKMSLAELAKPFKLGGTLAEPSLAIDSEQAAIALGKAVGGSALFGPAGIAAALVGKSSGDENPCVAAIEAAKKGVKSSETEKSKKKEGMIEKTTEGVKEGVKDVGKKLRRLFGN
ncbi:MAG TPA: AsmA family protein [Nitrospinota bacterium]|nr:AsmA family protein [Nitrospinota bacterium]